MNFRILVAAEHMGQRGNFIGPLLLENLFKVIVKFLFLLVVKFGLDNFIN